MQLGKALGTYRTAARPFWSRWLDSIGRLMGRTPQSAPDTVLTVWEGGISLAHGQADPRPQVYAYADVRRVWLEHFHAQGDHEGHTSFRIDIIGRQLDVIFSVVHHDCATDDPALLLMDELKRRWRQATWRHYHVVAAVVAHDGRYLCMQKPVTPYAYTSLHWEFPGGKVEPGETEQQALVRELREEMDYEVEIGRHLTTIEHSYPDFGITLSCWLCSAADTAFTRREHADHQWLTPAEMSALDWCAADRPVIELLAGQDQAAG